MAKPCKACIERRKWLAAQAKKISQPIKAAAVKVMSKGKTK